MASRRYDQLIDIVREVRPRTIVEIGVHKGLRAALMCREALKFQEKVAYFGFDVFDQEDAQFHADALNGKGMPSEQQAARRLNELGPALAWKFVKGDTRVTLHHERHFQADLVFIDGDHRLEVIRGDYEPFREARCVVLDDLYTSSLTTVDLEKYGCNGLVKDLQQHGKKVEILPVKDMTVTGAWTQLVVVRA